MLVRGQGSGSQTKQVQRADLGVEGARAVSLLGKNYEEKTMAQEGDGRNGLTLTYLGT